MGFNTRINQVNILGHGGHAKSQSGTRAMVYKAGIEPAQESQSVVSGRLLSSASPP